MVIGDSDDKKVIDIELEFYCEICNNPKISVKPEVSSSSSNNTDYLSHPDGSYGKNKCDFKLEPCCEICNPPKISIKLEPNRFTSDKPEYLRHMDGSDDKSSINTDIIMQSDNLAQNLSHEMQIKEVDNDSDVVVDLAYKIIDTSNVCELKIFKREGEKIVPDTKPLFKIDQTQLIVEVDNKIDLGYEMTDNLNVCDKEKMALKKESVDYDNLILEDDVNKQPVQLQSKGM